MAQVLHECSGGRSLLMFVKVLKMTMIAGSAALLLAGCQTGLRGPQVFAGFNGDPHCAPGPKPCPREYPEFPLPPGGPYLETPPYGHPGPHPANPTPGKLNLNNGSDKLTIAK